MLGSISRDARRTVKYRYAQFAFCFIAGRERRLVGAEFQSARAKFIEFTDSEFEEFGFAGSEFPKPGFTSSRFTIEGFGEDPFR